MKTLNTPWRDLTQYYRKRLLNEQPIKLFNYIKTEALSFYIWNN